MADADEVLRCAELFERVTEVHRRAAAAALGAFGVNESGSGLLWLLGEQRVLSMGAVALELACDPSNVTLIVGGLEDLGLVQRVADSEDRRRRLLQLTERGREARRAMVSAVRDASPLAALTDHQFRSLTAALRPLAFRAGASMTDHLR